jgi:hypothetical protein
MSERRQVFGLSRSWNVWAKSCQGECRPLCIFFLCSCCHKLSWLIDLGKLNILYPFKKNNSYKKQQQSVLQFAKHDRHAWRLKVYRKCSLARVSSAVPCNRLTSFLQIILQQVTGLTATTSMSTVFFSIQLVKDHCGSLSGNAPISL